MQFPGLKKLWNGFNLRRGRHWRRLVRLRLRKVGRGGLRVDRSDRAFRDQDYKTFFICCTRNRIFTFDLLSFMTPEQWLHLNGICSVSILSSGQSIKRSMIVIYSRTRGKFLVWFDSRFINCKCSSGFIRLATTQFLVANVPNLTYKPIYDCKLRR